MSKWNISLSTTEPYNNIGLVKVRMDNTSEVFRVQVTENGKPYDFTSKGINKVYFDTKFSRFNTVQQEGSIVDAKKGIIEYTLNDYDMQQAKPIQLAYFEFRKDDDYVDSTQTFGYHIMTSIYKECTDGQSYIVRLEELFKLYQDFMNQQSQSWEEFVKANREILESIDPGGKILTELIDSRDGEEDLATRLNRDKTKFEAEIDWLKKEHYLDTHGSVTTTRTLIDDNFTMNHTVTKIGEVADPNDDNPIVIATIDDDKQNRFKFVKVGEV